MKRRLVSEHFGPSGRPKLSFATALEAQAWIAEHHQVGAMSHVPVLVLRRLAQRLKPRPSHSGRHRGRLDPSARVIVAGDGNPQGGSD